MRKKAGAVLAGAFAVKGLVSFGKRAAAESSRDTEEGKRAAAEATRDAEEKKRSTAETGRAAAEQGREEAELGRTEAETARNVWEDYDGAKGYVLGNKVAYQGGSYRSKKACKGVLPTDAAHWLLIAAKGVDGEGAGDMLATVYDPTGKRQDVFGYADEAERKAKAASIPLAQKGAAGGVAPLGADGLVPVSHLPSQVKERQVVGTIAERDAIAGKFSGLQVYVKDATADPTVTKGGADYLWDGAAWIKTGEAESMDVVLKWENVQEKPETFPPVAHGHQVAEVTGALRQFGPVNLTIPVASWTGAGPWTQR